MIPDKLFIILTKIICKSDKRFKTSNFTPRASYKTRHKRSNSEVLCLKNKDMCHKKRTHVIKERDVRGRLINDHISSRRRNGLPHVIALRFTF